jgi:hypothetical protein
MKKRLFALLLALALLAALAGGALAAEEDSAAIRTVRALGIMVGDEYGNMNLSAPVTRAQFAKMLVAASRYRDSVSPDGSGYALYRDLKNDHWASEYIRIAAQEGWMTGYTDSTFRPENTITLEEVCASVLRLLGYDGASLAGSFPYAHLSKASALGLRDGLDCEMGQAMTRRDCAQLLYNAFSAQTASGQVYGTTLGLTVRDGEVDYISVLLDKLTGPCIADGGDTLSFTPVTVFRDGKASEFATLNPNDVYYYNTGLRSLWIYTKRASGKLESVTLSGGTPTAVTVSGKSYAVGGTDAAYRLSALGGTPTGSYVTLLLGMDDKVAGVLLGEAVNETYYGVIQSSVRSAAEDKAAVQTEVTVFCTDGTVRSFITARDVSYTAGSAVTVTVNSAGADVRGVVAHLTGRVSADGMKIGTSKLAQGVQIIDAAGDGTAVTVLPARLAGAELDGDDVRYYTRNAAGEIDRLILNDLTGDTWTYVYLTEVDDPTGAFGSNVKYTYLSKGRSTSFYGGGTKYGVEPGGGAIRFAASGSVRAIRQLSSFDVRRLENGLAMSDDASRALAEDVQVYLLQNGSFYLTELGAVNAWDYRLTGWYDSFSGSAGGLVRILIAAPK